MHLKCKCSLISLPSPYLCLPLLPTLFPLPLFPFLFRSYSVTKVWNKTNEDQGDFIMARHHKGLQAFMN